MVSRRMPSGNLGADPALVVPPTTEIGEASKKRKVAREALGKEKQSETGRKRPRAAGAGELAPTEVSRPGSTERETRASANPKATTGGEEPTLGPPSGSQALTSASDFVDSASESTQQTPIRRYPQSPTRAAGAPNTLQRPWSPPFTQVCTCILSHKGFLTLSYSSRLPCTAFPFNTCTKPCSFYPELRG